MQTAALMLAYHVDLSITEIGLACGYSSTSNFSKAFSRFFGVSPSEVRKPTGKQPAAISVLRQRYGHDFSPADLHALPSYRRRTRGWPSSWPAFASSSGMRCRSCACAAIMATTSPPICGCGAS
jgi:hypothetical protein